MAITHNLGIRKSDVVLCRKEWFVDCSYIALKYCSASVSASVYASVYVYTEWFM